MRDDDSDLVWSSDHGDLRKEPVGSGGQRRGGRRKKRSSAPAPKVAPGTRMKVRREVAGRKGKAVTTVTDIALPDAELKALAQKLKKRCGVGGTSKNGRIELQGDHRDVVLEFLKEAGYDAVAAGG
ncbi:MAG TPA: translation initiation factor [Solirubrobacterales bacterium]|nr:translation initiation factor [Solirubrobacterales bacterium]